MKLTDFECLVAELTEITNIGEGCCCGWFTFWGDGGSENSKFMSIFDGKQGEGGFWKHRWNICEKEIFLQRDVIQQKFSLQKSPTRNKPSFVKQATPKIFFNQNFIGKPLLPSKRLLKFLSSMKFLQKFIYSPAFVAFYSVQRFPLEFLATIFTLLTERRNYVRYHGVCTHVHENKLNYENYDVCQEAFLWSFGN